MPQPAVTMAATEELLPHIGDLPLPIQDRLRKFAQIAKDAVEARDDALRRLQGLENLSHILQECRAENDRNQDQFKWYEIVLLRTEADLLRTKKRLQASEMENEQLHQKYEQLQTNPQIPKESENGSFIVRDQSDGKNEKRQRPASVGDQTDQGPPSNRSFRNKRHLAPMFSVGISEETHNKTLQELELARRQLKETVEKENITYKEYLDAKKSEMQIQKLLETIKKKDEETEKFSQQLKEALDVDKDTEISNLKKELEKHQESDEMKVKVIEASNRRCQELKEENQELQQKYECLKENLGRRSQKVQEGSQASQDPSSDITKSSAYQRIVSEKQSLMMMVEKLTMREEELLLENQRTVKERDHIRKQYDTLQDSLEVEAQYGDNTKQKVCTRCNTLLQECSRLRDTLVRVEDEKSATVAQMKLFEDDFHKVREQLKFNSEKHQREISDSMKNCQLLSQELDRVKEENQKVRDFNQALEYQLSIVREYMKDHRPYYSVDSHPVARTSSRPVHNPSASPWQEGYAATHAVGVARDFADSRHEIEADSAYDELKGVESEEEAELTRR